MRILRTLKGVEVSINWLSVSNSPKALMFNASLNNLYEAFEIFGHPEDLQTLVYTEESEEKHYDNYTSLRMIRQPDEFENEIIVYLYLDE